MIHPAAKGAVDIDRPVQCSTPEHPEAQDQPFIPAQIVPCSQCMLPAWHHTRPWQPLLTRLHHPSRTSHSQLKPCSAELLPFHTHPSAVHCGWPWSREGPQQTEHSDAGASMAGCGWGVIQRVSERMKAPAPTAQLQIANFGPANLLRNCCRRARHACISRSCLTAACGATRWGRAHASRAAGCLGQS